MTKQQQDLSWACLPKEVREKFRQYYMNCSCGSEMEDMLETVFAEHNISSLTEPEEMLMVKRKDVVERYSEFSKEIDDAKSERYKNFCEGRINILANLFGDKCLPDKEESSNLSNIGKDEQPKPKFRKGEKVKIADERLETFGNIATISHCEVDDGKVFYWLNDDIGCHMESQLELYTEEKELNLVELLKDCEGEGFYSPAFGNIQLEESEENNLVFREDYNEAVDELIQTDREGVHSFNGMTIIFPSRALYEKYPLDAPRAWQEWSESRKPKRWRAERNKEYWYIDGTMAVCGGKEDHMKTDEHRYNRGNYFRTKELAEQAAEAVKETLMKFHEQNREQ